MGKYLDKVCNAILLGNGINAHLGIRDLSVEDIKDRFTNLVNLESTIISTLFQIDFDFISCCHSIEVSDNHGIETIADIFYSDIKKAKIDTWSVNDEIRLQDLIICMALNAIFFTKNGKIFHEFNDKDLLCFDRYDSVYTLNYYEFWDKNHICKHLHGFFDFEKIPDTGNLLLVNEARKSLDEYKSVVMNFENPVEYIDVHNMIFAPIQVMKENLINVKGLFPSDKLYPAQDLYPNGGIKLYEELDGIRELDIFGLSPYGDDSLIEILNGMDHVRVYVYNADENQESVVWDNMLHTEHEIIDSSYAS